MKKTVIIFIAILTLVSFGTVSSAHAVVDPISLTIILGAGFLTLVSGTELVKHHTKETAPVQKAEDNAGRTQTLTVLSSD